MTKHKKQSKKRKHATDKIEGTTTFPSSLVFVVWKGSIETPNFDTIFGVFSSEYAANKAIEYQKERMTVKGVTFKTEIFIVDHRLNVPMVKYLKHTTVNPKE